MIFTISNNHDLSIFPSIITNKYQLANVLMSLIRY